MRLINKKGIRIVSHNSLLSSYTSPKIAIVQQNNSKII